MLQCIIITCCKRDGSAAAYPASCLAEAHPGARAMAQKWYQQEAWSQRQMTPAVFEHPGRANIQRTALLGWHHNSLDIMVAKASMLRTQHVAVTQRIMGSMYPRATAFSGKIQCCMHAPRKGGRVQMQAAEPHMTCNRQELPVQHLHTSRAHCARKERMGNGGVLWQYHTPIALLLPLL